MTAKPDPSCKCSLCEAARHGERVEAVKRFLSMTPPAQRVDIGIRDDYETVEHQDWLGRDGAFP